MNRRLLTGLIVIALVWSCQKLEPIADNPLDPDNPDYEPPEVLISEGPVEGEIVDTSAVTFQWTGNELVTSYQYRFDSEVWSDWTSNTSASYYYLDEGDYSFSVQSQYETGDTSVVLNVSFVVDAVSGPALMFYPRRHIASIGETVTFQILAEEVSNLAAAEFSISYDPDEIEITAIDEGSIFTNLGNVFFLVDNGSEGEATIATAVWGESSPSAERTGVLATVEVKAKVTGSLVVSFDGSEVFRDPDNNDVLINETVAGQVLVE